MRTWQGKYEMQKREVPAFERSDMYGKLVQESEPACALQVGFGSAGRPGGELGRL